MLPQSPGGAAAVPTVLPASLLPPAPPSPPPHSPAAALWCTVGPNAMGWPCVHTLSLPFRVTIAPLLMSLQGLLPLRACSPRCVSYLGCILLHTLLPRLLTSTMQGLGQGPGRAERVRCGCWEGGGPRLLGTVWSLIPVSVQ